MDKEIVTAILLLGSAVITSAILAFCFINWKSRCTTGIQRKMFVLGSNIAKIGWAKIAHNPEREEILLSTMSLLRDLNLTQELEIELEKFAEKQESINELQESLQCIKGQIGRHLATHFGRKNVGYYNIGFNMINVTPILEQASMNIGEAGKVAAVSIHGIEGDACTLGLPTKNLKAIRKFVDKGLSSHKVEVFDEARLGLIKVGQNYIDILEGK